MSDITSQLQCAMQLSQSLMRKAKVDDDGVFWITGDERKSSQEGISDGVSGILLFFLELFRVTKDVQYLTIVDAGIAWAEKKARKKVQDFSFFTGRAGVVYTLLVLYETTHEEKYLERAESLSREVDFSLLSEQTKEFNLYEGLAGSVLVLLHLHCYTNASWIGEAVSILVRHILTRSKISKSGGIFWINEKRINIVTGLCGMAEGNSGIGYMFLELWHYSDNPAFLWVAEQCFLFEDALFNKKNNSWPDARTPVLTNAECVRQSNRYQYGLPTAEISRVGYSDGWAGGKTGIVLSRLRKLELTLVEADNQLNSVISDLKSLVLGYRGKNIDGSFLDGIIGPGLLMLEVYKSNEDERFLKAAKKLSCQLWKDYQTKENLSFKDSNISSGLAGLGYFFVKIFQCENEIKNYSSGIIRPDISVRHSHPNSVDAFSSFSLENVIESILESTYPRTSQHLKSAYNFNIKLNCDSSDSVNVIRSFMEDFIKDHAQDSLLADCYSYEHLISNTDGFYTNRMESYVRRFNDILRTKELISDKSKDVVIRNFRFRLTRDAVVHESKWCWSNSFQFVEEILKLGEEEHFTLLLPTEKEVREYPLEKAQALMLLKFGSKEKPIDVFHSICEEHDITYDRESITLLTEMFFELIRIGALMACHRILIRY